MLRSAATSNQRGALPMDRIQVVEKWWSQVERIHRTVRVYLPDAYRREPKRRFPVLYLLDGQCVFNHPQSKALQTWHANDALERLVADRRIEPWIAVAVDHSEDRLADYAPWDDAALDVAALGPLHLQFLTNELKPWVDRTLRTRTGPQETALVGASMSGLFSLWAGWKRPDVFGRVAGLSPAVAWGLGRLADEWQAHPKRWSRVYMDVGTEEGVFPGELPLDYPTSVRQLAEKLRGLGYADWELKLVVEEGAQHDVAAWRRRLPDVLGWLLGKW